MADILFKYPITAPASAVFDAIVTPKGLDSWWTLSSKGEPSEGSEYQFYFAPEYDWRGVLSEVQPGKRVVWTFTDAEPDWTGTQLCFDLAEKDGRTWVEFNHRNWDGTIDHFRHSSYCWAMYLRHLKRFVEEGIVVPYSERDND